MGSCLGHGLLIHCQAGKGKKSSVLSGPIVPVLLKDSLALAGKKHFQAEDLYRQSTSGAPRGACDGICGKLNPWAA